MRYQFEAGALSLNDSGYFRDFLESQYWEQRVTGRSPVTRNCWKQAGGSYSLRAPRAPGWHCWQMP